MKGVDPTRYAKIQDDLWNIFFKGQNNDKNNHIRLSYTSKLLETDKEDKKE